MQEEIIIQVEESEIKRIQSLVKIKLMGISLIKHLKIN